LTCPRISSTLYPIAFLMFVEAPAVVVRGERVEGRGERGERRGDGEGEGREERRWERGEGRGKGERDRRGKREGNLQSDPWPRYRRWRVCQSNNVVLCCLMGFAHSNQFLNHKKGRRKEGERGGKEEGGKEERYLCTLCTILWASNWRSQRVPNFDDRV
jgi:hypothetical protein